jgi:hypothetical protein
VPRAAEARLAADTESDSDDEFAGGGVSGDVLRERATREKIQRVSTPRVTIVRGTVAAKLRVYWRNIPNRFFFNFLIFLKNLYPVVSNL